ncbi:MAG: pyridoxamine 5'-phosphate oxidase family protein [Dehalococcoidia bacterium]|nr:pyridoxamine 5'-phosphate oxidase family protein [Dehalococcoidia bacterium]
MAKLTADMMDFLKGKMAYVATITPEGLPHIGPKGSFKVFDDEHIGWNESTGKQTFANLQSNTNVAIAVADRESRIGYRFTGKAQVLRDGALYDSTAEEYAKTGRKAPFAVVCMAVEDIYDVGAGASRGTKLT